MKLSNNTFDFLRFLAEIGITKATPLVPSAVIGWTELTQGDYYEKN